jgi:hypothetical protein
MVAPDQVLRAAVGGEEVATTNLWYARLCRSAARADTGALLGALPPDRRLTLVAALAAPPVDIVIVPMTALAWRMGVLSAQSSGLSALGSEAVAAAEMLQARLLVSSRDDAPGVRRCCRKMRIRYATIRR